MKIIGKILAVPGMLTIRTAAILIEMFGRISSIFGGPFLMFVTGCCIYSAATFNWRNFAILAVAAGTCALFYSLLGLLLGLADIACDRLKHLLMS